MTMQIPGILFWLAIFSALADPLVGLALLIASASIALIQRIYPRIRQAHMKPLKGDRDESHA
jgi:hypothetical protein